MGMIASGHISDAVLNNTLEKGFVLKPGTRRKFGILFYARFRRDILLIVKSHADARHFLIEEMRTHAAPFVLKVEGVSKHGCQMLDLEVCFSGVENDRLSFSLYQKPSSIWQPQSPESSHPFIVHKYWPIAQCRRIYSKFTNVADAERAVNSFKALYFNSFGVAVSAEPGPKLPKVSTSWLVLPFNLCFGLTSLSEIVSSMPVPSWFPFRKVRLSWGLGNKHLVHLFRRR